MDYQLDAYKVIQELLPSELSSALEDLRIFADSGAGKLLQRALNAKVKAETEEVLQLGGQTGEQHKADECKSIGRIEVLQALAQPDLGIGEALAELMKGIK